MDSDTVPIWVLIMSSTLLHALYSCFILTRFPFRASESSPNHFINPAAILDEVGKTNLTHPGQKDPRREL